MTSTPEGRAIPEAAGTAEPVRRRSTRQGSAVWSIPEAAGTAEPVRRRSTRQGSAVWSILAAEATAFRTAQQLHDALRDRGEPVALATVYRHLNTMAAEGSVDVVQSPGGEATFRLCGPGQDERGHHHHLVCRVCGRSVEVAGAEVDSWIDRVSAAAGFTDTTHVVEVFGLCSEHPTP